MAEARIDLVKAAMAAWGRHDVDEVLARVSPDIVWHYQVGSRPVHGREAMGKVLNRLKDHQLDSRWRVTRHAETDNTLFIEAVEDYRNPDGHRVRAPYMGVYEFDGDLISGWRDYVDMGLLMKSEAGEQPPEWLESLIGDDPAS